jgi:hypothetical protein
VNVSLWLRTQPIDATQALNISAGVANPTNITQADLDRMDDVCSIMNLEKSEFVRRAIRS